MEFVDYTPRPEALEHLQQVDLVAIIGATAVGKSTVLDRAIALDPSIHLVLSTTTRPARPGEHDGVDYHFRSEANMQERIARREYVQVAPKISDFLYATAPEDYTTKGTAAMAILADGIQAFQALPFKRIRQIVILPPDFGSWKERIASHRFDGQQLAKRMDEARRSLTYAVTAPNLLFLVNDDLEQAAFALARAIRTSASPLPEAEGRNLARKLLEGMSAEYPTKGKVD